MKIVSNHQYRYFLSGYELPEKIRKSEFDYINDGAFAEENFMKYKGEYYCMNDFVRIVKPNGDSGFAHIDYAGDLKGWNGIFSETYFSGLVIKISDYGDAYKIGRYCSL